MPRPKIQILSYLDRDLWGKLRLRTRRALMGAKAGEGRVLKVDFKTGNFESLVLKKGR